MRGSARESEIETLSFTLCAREMLRGSARESEDRQVDREFCETPSDEAGPSELPPSSFGLLFLDDVQAVEWKTAKLAYKHSIYLSRKKKGESRG